MDSQFPKGLFLLQSITKGRLIKGTDQAYITSGAVGSIPAHRGLMLAVEFMAVK
jgi:hypothetical protein